MDRKVNRIKIALNQGLCRRANNKFRIKYD